MVSLGYIFPEGLLGEFIKIPLVLGVMAASILSKSGYKFSSVSIITGFPFDNFIIPLYGPKNGANIIISPYPKSFFTNFSTDKLIALEVPPGTMFMLLPVIYFSFKLYC